MTDARFRIVSASTDKVANTFPSRILCDVSQTDRATGWHQLLYPAVGTTIAQNARGTLPNCAKELTIPVLARTVSMHHMLL